LQALHRALYQYGKKHLGMAIGATEFAKENFKHSDHVKENITHLEKDLTDARRI